MRHSFKGSPLMPAGPITRWLEALPADVEDYMIERVTGVDARILRGLRNGEKERITLDTADRLLTRWSGSPQLLNELYPVDGELAA
jgi:hypothetical protein